MKMNIKKEDVIEYLEEALPSKDTDYDVWYDDMNGRWVIEPKERKSNERRIVPNPRTSYD